MTDKQMRWYPGQSRSQIKLDRIVIFYCHDIIFSHFKFDESLGGVILQAVS